MLGTPPAFVLSQDQTLKKLYLNSFRCSNHFSKYLLLAIYFRIFVGRFRLRLNNIHLIVQGVHFVLSLFNLQGTVRSRLIAVNLGKFITKSFPCQPLFSRFSRFFFVFAILPSLSQAVHRTASLYYHCKLYLSSIFIQKFPFIFR